MTASPATPIDLPAAADPAVSIVVLFTDRPELARGCLEAIAGAADAGIPCEVVAVLNAAGEEVEALFAGEVRGARVVRTTVNAGTAAGWNLGFEAARAPRVALLHEDAAPRPGWLPPLLDALAGPERPGAAGSRLVLPDGGVENGGWVYWADGAVTQLDARTAPFAIERTEPYAVDGCSSACLLVDRDAWRAAGGFDERFHPAVYADTDLCTALAAMGRPVLSVPASVVVHRKNAMVREGAGVLRGFGYQRFLVDRNRERFAAKWGDRLAGYEPRDPAFGPWDAPAADVERALARCGRRGPIAGALPQADRALTGGDPATLERRLLAAESAVRAEFCERLAAQSEAERERAGAAEARAAALEPRLAGAEQRLAEREAELADARARADEAEARRAEREAEVAWLYGRAATLERILGGRTWRTRTALKRLLRRPG